MEILLILFFGGMCISPVVGAVLGLFVSLAAELDDWSTKQRAKRKKKRAKKSKGNIWQVIIRG